MKKISVIILLLSFTICSYASESVEPIVVKDVNASIKVSDTSSKMVPGGLTLPFGSAGEELRPSISIGEVLIKVAVGLAIVLLFITVLAWLSKKTGINRLAQNKKIRLRESVSLSTKEKLVVVDFAGESLLLGVGSGKVTLLKCVPELPLTPASTAKASLGAKTALDFQHKLNEFLMKGSQ